MTTILLEKKYVDVPTEWNELRAKQLLDIIDIFYNKEYKGEEILLLLLKALLSFGNIEFARMKAEDIEEYVYLVGFLFEDKSYLTKQLFAEYDQLHGPEEELNNVVMKEFVFSEHFFMQWQEDRNNDALLNDFISTIYRPAKRDYDHSRNPDGDSRIKFNENLCEWYSEHIISKWPKKVKLAIAHWYAGCRRKIVDDNPDVFGGSGEAAKHGLISIIREIAKQGAHGNFEAVENMNINLVMVELNEIVEEGKQMEQQMLKMK
jgi:hypothetical protein